jgi:hypothetical protein
MWEIVTYVLSAIGIVYTVTEALGAVIKRASSFIDLLGFLYRYIVRRNRYYRNFRGLRIEYWMKHPRIIAEEQMAKFNVQIENISQSHFKELRFYFDLPNTMKMVHPGDLFMEELEGGQEVRYTDMENDLSIGDLIRRQYEFSYEGHEISVDMEIVPFIIARKEIDGKMEGVGPEQLHRLSLRVKRKS